jgi:hypothetical protein
LTVGGSGKSHVGESGPGENKVRFVDSPEPSSERADHPKGRVFLEDDRCGPPSTRHLLKLITLLFSESISIFQAMLS